MVAQVIPSDHNIFYGVLCLWLSYFILLQYLPIKKNEPKKKKKKL